MSCDGRYLVLTAALAMTVWGVHPGRTAEPPPAANLPAVHPPAFIPPPAAIGGAGPADGIAGVPLPVPGVLRDIGQRQTELTLLELDIKRAELQKKLRELEAGPGPIVGLPSPPALPASTTMPPPAVAEGGEPPTGPAVRRIHKVDGQLAALIAFPSGETKEVRRGGAIANGLKVVEVRSDGVLVQQGDRPAFQLPVTGARRGGQ